MRFIAAGAPDGAGGGARRPGPPRGRSCLGAVISALARWSPKNRRFAGGYRKEHGR